MMDSPSLATSYRYTLEEAGLSSLPVNASAVGTSTALMSATYPLLSSPTAMVSTLANHSELEPELPTQLAGLKNGPSTEPMPTSIEFKMSFLE
jgi:hypothetical protein